MARIEDRGRARGGGEEGKRHTVHVIGLGLGGLSAAVRLAEAGVRVALYDAAGQAGGRCRSFHDAKLGHVIDNGNHLLLSGNDRALAYLDLIGGRGKVHEFPEAAYPFLDLATGERWTVRLSDGALPTWLLDPARRVRGAGLAAHLGAGRIALARPRDAVWDIVPRDGPMATRFWEPMTVAVLNTTPDHGSAVLMRRVLMATFARGGRHARPIIAASSLGAAFVEPALGFLEQRGATPRFHRRLKGIVETNGAHGGPVASALDFADGALPLAPGDRVILALPPSRLADILPGSALPADDAVIVNAHFVLPDGAGVDDRPAFLGLLNATSQWIFRRGPVVSVTISAADRLGLDRAEAEPLLSTIWREVATALGLPEGAAPSASRLIRERRATFDQSPAALALRPTTRTRLANVFLAGDVVDTGLPATIEGAIRSGEMAARAARRSLAATPSQSAPAG